MCAPIGPSGAVDPLEGFAASEPLTQSVSGTIKREGLWARLKRLFRPRYS